TDSLIICDQGNQRVVRWSHRSGTTQGEILIDNIYCYGIAMDEQRYLYVSDARKHEVRRYQLGEKKPGTVIVGGNRSGAGASQFSYPIDLSFDRHGNLYVVDMGNHHVQRFYIE
ncbi:unnamed protein product, partial [Rotaria magnacalcarata]